MLDTFSVRSPISIGFSGFKFRHQFRFPFAENSCSCLQGSFDLGFKLFFFAKCILKLELEFAAQFCLNPVEFFTLIGINGPHCSGYTWRNHKIKYALNYIVYIPGDNYIIPFFTNLTQFATTSGLFAPALAFALSAFFTCLLLLLPLLFSHLFPLFCGRCSILFGSRLCAKVRVIQFFMRRQAASVCTQRGVTGGGATFRAGN